MGNTLSKYFSEDDKSSPRSNDRKAAPEGAGRELVGLPKINTGSGMDLAPIGNLYTMVNKNLRDCPFKTCKGCQLKLELDCRIGFASC